MFIVFVNHEEYTSSEILISDDYRELSEFPVNYVYEELKNKIDHNSPLYKLLDDYKNTDAYFITFLSD